MIELEKHVKQMLLWSVATEKNVQLPNVANHDFPNFLGQTGSGNGGQCQT